LLFIDQRLQNIPDKLISGSRLGDEFNYLDSCDIDKILIETFNFYSYKFNNLIQNIDSYQFFDNSNFLWVVILRLDLKSDFQFNNSTKNYDYTCNYWRSRKIKKNLKAPRKPDLRNYELIGELYEMFININ